MEEKLKEVVKEKTISDKREKSVSEILDQGTILTMRKDIAFLKKEEESVLAERKQGKENRLINMIKAKAGEAGRVEREKKQKKREEMEKREKELEKERQDIENIKTKAKEKEIEIIIKKQKELAEEKEKERIKEEEEQKRRIETSKIEEEDIIQGIRKRAIEEGKDRKKRLVDRKILEEKLKKERKEAEERLKEFSINRAPLEEQREKIDQNKDMLKDILKDILKDEASLENRKRSIERKESETKDPIEKHKIEKERWRIEKSIKEIEEQKWKQLGDIRKIEDQIKNIDIKLEVSIKEEDRLKEIEKKTIDLQEKIKLEKEKEKIKKEIELYHLQLAPLISEKVELETKDKQINKNLQNILTNETEIERKIKVFKEKKQEAGNLEQEKKLGEEIWKMEQERQSIEKDRWEKQKDVNKDLNRIREIDSSYKKIFTEKEKLEATITEINNLLENAEKSSTPLTSEMSGIDNYEEEKKIEKEIKPEDTPTEKVQPEQKREDIIFKIKERIVAEEKVKQAEESSKKMGEEKTETFVGKEQEVEVDKIEKRRLEMKRGQEAEEDSRRALRKKEALKDLEKISPDEEKERNKFLNRIKDKQKAANVQESNQTKKIFTLEKPGGEIVYRPLPKTQSSQEKILMRILIFLLFVSVIIAIYLLKSKYI
jgi:hypothetical protein